MNGKANVWARRRARRALLQAVYQWQLSGNDFSAIRADFQQGDALKKADVEFFEELLGKVVRRAPELDAAYVSLLDRGVEQLDHVERAILRLATAEFMFRIDIPYRVVINEYVDLAKSFGATDSFKYINGVLDKLAEQLRAIEVEAARG
jgi:N utilization substance protein B